MVSAKPDALRALVDAHLDGSALAEPAAERGDAAADRSANGEDEPEAIERTMVL